MGPRLEKYARKAGTIYRFIGPLLSLKSGFVSVFLLRRGVDFAPVAVAGLLFGWMLARVLMKRLAPREGELKRRGVLRFLGTQLVAAIYQYVLFFLLPVWFGSMTPSSINVIAPSVLAAMALFTCFDRLYTAYVVKHPAVLAAFSAVVLFATLVAALPIFVRAPLRATFAAAAAFSVLLAAIAALPYERLRKWRTAGLTALASIGAAISMALAAPIFPPVPVQETGHASGLAILEREPQGVAEEFDAGVERVYVWFAVAAPDKYSETIRFEVFRDGEPLGKPFETEFTGGRKSGYRTWTYVSNPRPGKYRVDLYAGSDQLVARHSFRVRQP